MIDTEEMTSEVAYDFIPSNVEGSTSEDDVKITHRAMEEIKRIRLENLVPEDFGLRISTQGGGCSGMNYSLGFDNQVEDYDRVFKVHDLHMIVDAKSLFYVMGITLDYIENEGGSGFTFYGAHNQATCGCKG